jgi:DNA-cytosine methyltransferase
MSFNILSCFDGMSCGQIALNKCGIKYDKYYASEIDKNAINVTLKNYPNTIQLGSVREVRGNSLPQIDLLIAGSPCQGFSFAGKQLNFDDPRSKLFFEFVRLLGECKPKYFLLENVVMKKEYQDVITEHLGVEPIFINSSLISAQNRKRLYWTNIPNITLPEDKGIKLQDILEDGITDKEKAYCLTLHTGTVRDYFKKNQTNIVYIPDDNGLYEVKDGKISMSFPKGKNPNEVFTFKVKVPDGKYNFRKLTVSELEQLQNVPIGYTQGFKYTNSVDVLGNGWTVDVITHIFSFLKENVEKVDFVTNNN